MRHHAGLKLGEIADALGLAEGTVKRQLHTAIHRLRAVLAAAKVTVEAGS
jgi:DNA-directed RNA polymerase specialized sigma24 family protein